jgi:hypothetical protein
MTADSSTEVDVGTVEEDILCMLYGVLWCGIVACGRFDRKSMMEPMLKGSF